MSLLTGEMGEFRRDPLALLEAVLILACVVQHAALDLVSDEPVATRPLITLRPKYGIRMRVAEPTMAHAHPLIGVS